MGRAAAGYVNYKEGGVGPVLNKIVPLAERAQFHIFAATLLEGPPLDPKLRVSFALVLLLRYDAVKSSNPGHRLLVEIRGAMIKCRIHESVFNAWVTSSQMFNTEANKSGLSLQQVIFNLYYEYAHIYTNGMETLTRTTKYRLGPSPLRRHCTELSPRLHKYITSVMLSLTRLTPYLLTKRTVKAPQALFQAVCRL